MDGKLRLAQADGRGASLWDLEPHVYVRLTAVGYREYRTMTRWPFQLSIMSEAEVRLCSGMSVESKSLSLSTYVSYGWPGRDEFRLNKHRLSTATLLLN